MRWINIMEDQIKRIQILTKKKGIIFHKPEIQEEKNRKIVVNLTWKVSMKIFR
jgi:hypothetical protein